MNAVRYTNQAFGNLPCGTKLYITTCTEQICYFTKQNDTDTARMYLLKAVSLTQTSKEK